MESSGIERALELESGARYCKCALHLNPYDYLVRNNRATPFADEAAYNKAIVEAALANDIEVVAITDHYRILSAVTLIEATEAAGIVVLPGFEAVTKEGIHVLALFDPGTPAKRIERVIGDCGIHDTGAVSPTGKYDVVQCVENAREWAAVFVAAHVYSSGGLLQALKGEARIKAWTNPGLLACSVAGSVSSAPDSIRAILENKDPNYKRARRMAILNAQDVVCPEDLADSSSYCWVKMSKASVEGLRQAFLEPESRIRLETDPAPTEHVELACVAWQGGFLDGEAIHLNENLNVLIGGRGTGKSTVVESIRYVLGLEPLGEEAAKNHGGIVQHVLKSGTKISLLVHSYRPNRRDYILERTVPNPSVVKDMQNDVLDLRPLDVVPGVEVYGQHELSELSRSPRKLARLLDRFVKRDDDLATQRDELRRELESLRISRLKLQKESDGIRLRLSRLPVLEETLGRFKEAGLEDRLKERSEIVREETILKSADERIRALRIATEKFEEELPLDTSFVSAEALDGLGGAPILAPVRESLEKLSERVEALLGKVGAEISEGG